VFIFEGAAHLDMFFIRNIFVLNIYKTIITMNNLNNYSFHKPILFGLTLFFTLIQQSTFLFSQTTQTFTSNGTFTVPCGVTSITVRTWGAGGGGGSRNSDGTAAGGGGGAYAQSTLAVTEYAQYSVTIGAGGGAGMDGGATIFGANLVVAAGGKGVPLNGQVGGLGGAIADCIGAIRYSGGNGSAPPSATSSGAGGGGAGTTGNGNNASGTTAGAARTLSGGAGGAGRTTAGNGNGGANYGGGGGGSRRGTVWGLPSGGTGGLGASGYVEITFTVPTITSPSVTGGTVCGAGEVTLSASGAVAGQNYNWYTTPTLGTAFQTGGSTAIVSAPSTTTYYVTIQDLGTGCESPRIPVVANFTAPAGAGLDAYTVTRTTAVTFTSISGTGTAVTSWKNGTNRDDNMSNPIPIGFGFPYDGGIQQQVLIGTNGFLTFNTATKADGGDIAACGTPEPYTWQNTNFSLATHLGSKQVIAPFYNDLYTNNALNSSIYYRLEGTAPNRIFKVEWRGMYNDYSDKTDCPKLNGNLNFQAWLYETSGNIEFYYGTMQQTTWDNTSSECSATLDNTYTSGINSSTLTSSPTLSQLITQQTANTATFSATPVNNLTTLPAASTRITFTRTIPAAPASAPSCIAYNSPNNFSTNQCLNQILSWADASPEATSYDVFFGTASNPPFVANTTHTFYNPGNLAMNTTYYWRIVPKNAFGEFTGASVWRFTTGVGDIQPTQITSSLGTLIQQDLVGYTALGEPIYTNTYEVCSGISGGTLTAVGPHLSQNSELSWTNPVYFFGIPAAVCTDAIPANFTGNCNGLTQSPIIGAGAWLTAMFNGGYIIYDVFTRGCNDNSSCTRIILKLTNTPTNGTVQNTGETICAGGDPIEFGLSSLPGGADQYTYQWYQFNGVTTAPTGSTIPPGWTPVGTSATVSAVSEQFGGLPSAPSGWTFSGIATETSCPGGSSSPSARFAAQNNRIVTEMYAQAVGSLSFLLGARVGAVTMLVEASSNGTDWTTVATINRASGAFGSCASGTYSYSFPLSANYRQFRFTRTTTGSGVLSLDDVKVYLGGATYDPPAGATSSTTYAVFITPIGSNCGVPGWAGSQWVVNVNSGNPSLPNTWNGSVSTDWFNPQNWNCMIPVCGQDVIIPTGMPRYPAINDLEGTGAACRSITIQTGASLTTVANANLDVCGNWTNNGVFTPNTGTISFVGNALQTIFTQTNFYNLRINNTSVEGVNLSTSQYVDNVLTLIDGKVNTGIHKIIVTNNQPNKVVYGGSNPLNYSNSWINGNLHRAFATNTGVYDFPVGCNSYSALARLTNGSITGVTSIDAWYREPLTTTSPLDPAKAIDFGTAYQSCYPDGYWYLEPETSTMTSGNYTLQLFFNGFSTISSADDNSFGIVKRPSTSSSSMDWSTQIPSDGAGTLSASNGPGRLFSDGYAQRNNLTMFSHFAIAFTSDPLPIELAYFGMKCLDRSIRFEWITASETNNDYFTIQASKDGVNFIDIKQIKGAGSTSSAKEYFIVVDGLNSAFMYFRLKQTDFDGKYSYSELIVNTCKYKLQNNGLVSVSPNPATSHILVNFEHLKNAYYDFEIINLIGQVIQDINLYKSLGQAVEIPLNVAAGQYLLRVTNTISGERLTPVKFEVIR
jgi:hypothetical protein